MSVGGPHAEVGLKPQLNLRGHATKEEELKSLTAVQIADLHPCYRLCKLSACRTSEQTMSAPTAKTGLALAAMDFVGMYMQGLGQARV